MQGKGEYHKKHVLRESVFEYASLRIPQFFIGFKSQKDVWVKDPLFQLIKLLLAYTMKEFNEG
jgi:hypothetical protein